MLCPLSRCGKHLQTCPWLHARRLSPCPAELQYRAARLVRRKDEHGRLVFGMAGAETEIVSERGRGGSGLNTVGGSGEREAVKQRSRITGAVRRVKLQLQEVRRRRAAARDKRRSGGHRTAALLGYTNAGKSSAHGGAVGRGVRAQAHSFNSS